MTLVDMQLVRGSSLTGFPALAGSHGGDPAVLLALSGIDLDDVGEHDRYIPLRNAIAALENAATTLDVVDFGRQLGQLQSIDILGPVAVAARTAATVAEAFSILDTYMSSHSPAITARITDHGNPALRRFEYDFLLQPSPPQSQAVELALSLTLRVLRLFLGNDYRPVAVHLPHAALGGQPDYLSHFGCTPHFNEAIAGFTLRAADLQRPLNHDPLAHQLALAYLTEARGRPTADITTAVSAVARQLLPTGELTAVRVARQFGIHPKSLQRRLVAEQTTFADLIDRTRRELAHRLLLDTDLPLAQISRQLGYAEHSVFTRACKRWFAMTPTAYRAQHR